MRLHALFWPAVATLLSWLHCTTDRIAGNASETGNPSIVGVLYESAGKNAAAGAMVVIRPKLTLAGYPDKDFSGTVKPDSTVTNDSGRFTFDTTIEPGTYIIEAVKGGNALLIDPVVVVSKDSTVVLPPDTLEPTGALKGVVRLSEGEDPRKTIISAYGFDRKADVDADGAFLFSGLPEGSYHLLIWSAFDDYGIVDTQNITVRSAETTDIGVIRLPFTGIPTIQGLTASYDTLMQQVTLCWERPQNGLVTSFNVYRRIIDPPSAVFTQLNVFPVTDTGYTDTRCEQNRTYEYRVTAVDSNTNEGKRSAGASVAIAVYDITPGQPVLHYDTLRQTVSLHWSNPDPSLVTGYNMYRRNTDLGETFRTPLNNHPAGDTFFVDSSFPLYPASGTRSRDTADLYGPAYEYCIRAVIREVREGAESATVALRVSLKFITPINVHADYDIVRQAVDLSWNILDTTLLQGYSVFRRDIDADENTMTQISGAPFTAAGFTDSSGTRNRTYEYRIASLLLNERATVMSTAITVSLAASYAAKNRSAADDDPVSSEFRNEGENSRLKPLFR